METYIVAFLFRVFRIRYAECSVNRWLRNSFLSYSKLLVALRQLCPEACDSSVFSTSQSFMPRLPICYSSSIYWRATFFWGTWALAMELCTLQQLKYHLYQHIIQCYMLRMPYTTSWRAIWLLRSGLQLFLVFSSNRFHLFLFGDFL